MARHYQEEELSSFHSSLVLVLDLVQSPATFVMHNCLHLVGLLQLRAAFRRKSLVGFALELLFGRLPAGLQAFQSVPRPQSLDPHPLAT